MPPTNFEKLAGRAFNEIKRSVSTDAIYMPKAGGSFPVRGPFDDRAAQVDPNTEKVISSNVYTFGLKLEDIPNVPIKGDKLIISEITYQVIDSQEDGAPDVSTFLILHRVKTV